jgi:hypothetical protein
VRMRQVAAVPQPSGTLPFRRGAAPGNATKPRLLNAWCARIARAERVQVDPGLACQQGKLRLQRSITDKTSFAIELASHSHRRVVGSGWSPKRLGTHVEEGTRTRAATHRSVRLAPGLRTSCVQLLQPR